jgi:hypothetical protein
MHKGIGPRIYKNIFFLFLLETQRGMGRPSGHQSTPFQPEKGPHKTATCRTAEPSSRRQTEGSR